MLYSSTSVRQTWSSGTAARLACHRILAPARQPSTLPAPTETRVQPLCAPRGGVAMPRAHCIASIAHASRVAPPLRSTALPEPPLLPLTIREEKTRRRGGSEKGPLQLQLQSLRLQEDVLCTPPHASRGLRDVSGLAQLAAYHHGTGIRSACTKRVNPSGLTAAGCTAHLHPNADDVFE